MIMQVMPAVFPDPVETASAVNPPVSPHLYAGGVMVMQVMPPVSPHLSHLSLRTLEAALLPYVYPHPTHARSLCPACPRSHSRPVSCEYPQP